MTCLAFAGQRGWHSWHEFDEKPDEKLSDPDDKMRPIGNHGHTWIDFGGQWTMGRMVVRGNARHLYDRRLQWPIVREGFPESDESPHQRRNAFPASEQRDPDTSETTHDAAKLMSWFMGSDSNYWDHAGEALALTVCVDAVVPNPLADVIRAAKSRELLIPTAKEDQANLESLALLMGQDSICWNPVGYAATATHAISKMRPNIPDELGRPAIGGPLYPPIHGLLYSPLGLFDRPQYAYRVMQIVSMLLTFTAGLGFSVLSRGRVWWSLAVATILVFPGYRSGLDLAQNQIFTLNILIWGWVLASRNRDIAAGIVWGFLAYKPVWAATFFMAPLFLGRLRMCLAMGTTGLGLIALTLPFTGIQAWFDWLKVGKEASDLYCVCKNWIELSRDLFGLPRRMLLDFNLAESERSNLWADRLGWLLWFLVLGTTVETLVLRGKRGSTTSYSAGFVLLACYLLCYRFMYYDALLAAFPVLVLVSTPSRLWRTGGWDQRGDATDRWKVRFSSPLFVLILALFLLENWFMHSGFERKITFPPLADLRPRSWEPSTVATLTFEPSVYQAWDTVILLMVWMWCRWRILMSGDRVK